MNAFLVSAVGLLVSIFVSVTGAAQSPPSDRETATYNRFFKAVYAGDQAAVREILATGVDLEQKDGSGRTALHIAAFQSHDSVFQQLAGAGSNVNALENSQYDVITIAAVANDLEMLRLALKFGGNPKNVTSPYGGTALIAAAHLGHVDVVRTLLAAGSSVDHINNLGWTALLEAVILGDGGTNYQAVVKDLLLYGANKLLTDGDGRTALMLARQSGYAEIETLLK